MRRYRWWLLALVVATSACGSAHAATVQHRPAAPLTLRVLRPLITGRCPIDPLPLSAADSNLARAAVLLAVTPRTNPHEYADASVRIYAMNRIDRTYAVKRCGTLVAGRSLVVGAAFPHLSFSAALSYDTFYVARTPRGWSLWDLTPGGGD